ncbi:hypothetical protein JDV02_010668 [Purpureocillium takamizusanense]|uniref:Uncharacterized protein n=1 Tax=Purpureocillium takamizusanense TaxID=2060973 RepID=A0A9Q8QPC3_9HYPO|nr:uncharacterized protein JDV02_010668 [Purpureocillium takamizusanense]UNI24954.1 hypothetical protein JDV02_010668 [Purpureocillium takamizusanense]
MIKSGEVGGTTCRNSCEAFSYASPMRLRLAPYRPPVIPSGCWEAPLDHRMSDQRVIPSVPPAIDKRQRVSLRIASTNHSFSRPLIESISRLPALGGRRDGWMHRHSI